MIQRGASFLCLCILAMHLIHGMTSLPIDPKIRAHLEAKVMSAMSLKDIEAMVENDERVVNAPKSKLIIIPKPKTSGGLIGGENEREAIIIHRKPKKHLQTPQYQYNEPGYNDNTPIRRSSYEPNFLFESEFREEDSFPSLFKISDLETAATSPVRQFYESIVQSVMEQDKFGLERDPFSALEFAASEDVPQYQPRFDYDGYSKDSTETKLKGKPYWKDAPERKEEMVDENGCRTVIKKVVDPDDEKKSSSEKAKSVVITKECEYPTLNGPDAKISETPQLKLKLSRFHPQSSRDRANYQEEPLGYEQTRPTEFEIKQAEARDPLAPDYIDSMLDKHFKSFPGFSNPLTSFKGYQDRFKLRTPEAFKDVKPTIGVHTYERTHPKSGFEEERQAPAREDSSPKVIEHHYHYDYPEEKPRKSSSRDYDEEYDAKDAKKASEPSDPKEPKMLKKSFAYYRKDNPNSDPNDQQYAEEYAQGNYRSFSTSYDSEKDGPEKKQ